MRVGGMTEHEKKLNDAVVVIFGASSGLGRGAAEALAEEGAKVVLAARRGDLLSAISSGITARGGQATFLECDVSRAADVAAVAAHSLEKFGRIDVWVNNVGVGALGFFWDTPVEDQARVIDVNFKGLMFGAHEALKLFRAQGHGVLVNTGSIDSEIPVAFQTTYAATKAAVLSLSRSLNEELRLSGQGDSIKVATIMPWAVDTPWWIHAANYTGHAPRMAAMDSPKSVVDAIVQACTHPKEEMPVGAKARISDLFHHLMPDTTERMTADIASREIQKAAPRPPTTGSLYTAMQEGCEIGGGIRERMKGEDEQRKG